MQPRLDLRLGIDVGGTNTDAVVLGPSEDLIAKAKAPTTPDVDRGISAAIDGVLAESGVVAERISHVMIGTTHSANAVVERQGLRRVGVVRIGAPATEAVPPLATWPADLRAAVSGGEVIIQGGVEFDGRLVAPFDREALIQFLDQSDGAVDALAIVSVFAPVSDRHERMAEEIVRERLGDVPLSLSHEIGALGILERENATVLNSALFGVAENIARALDAALAARGIKAATYFAQNDGTLMALEYVLRRPVLTIGSGSSNSMRGAAFLSGLSDVMVADIGGTSTDVGILVNGFPRESAIPLDIGNVSTNFRMPDLLTIAAGGGTIVTADGAGVLLGPGSVRHRVLDVGLAFGGSTPTLTDAAVHAGRLDLGSRDHTTSHGAMLEAALREAEGLFAEAIDRIKTDRQLHPLVVVGGAAALMPDNPPGVSEVIRPDHHDVANAIGAAIAPVGGQVDRVVHRATTDRREAIADAAAAARAEAIRAGAHPDHVETVEVEEVPMAYLPDPAVRLRVRAVGPLGAL